MRMRTSPDTDDLDLPPLDGDEPDGDEEALADELDGFDGAEHAHELGDVFDDATSEGDPLEEIASEGAEAGWLLDAEEGGKALDVGAFDVEIAGEEALLEPDEPEPHGIDEDLGEDEEAVHGDGGEEGPLAEDEELREEDLPALDADDEGDVADELLFDRGTLDTGEELHWDDRAWARIPALAAVREGGEHSDADDSGALLVPGDDPKHAARDATWRRLDEGGTVTAVAMVPGDSVVLALDRAGRPLLVRIQTDGVARIIAEIDTSATDDEVEACRVTSLRWDTGTGCVVATGAFGTQVFRPA